METINKKGIKENYKWKNLSTYIVLSFTYSIYFHTRIHFDAK